MEQVEHIFLLEKVPCLFVVPLLKAADGALEDRAALSTVRVAVRGRLLSWRGFGGRVEGVVALLLEVPHAALTRTWCGRT